MEDSNMDLIKSLHVDLKELTATSKAIQNELEPNGLNSWLNPTITCLESINNTKNTKTLNYQHYLELIIDRLYFVINSFDQFLETKMKRPEKNSFKKRKAIRPKNLTLSGSVNKLWEALFIMQEREGFYEPSSQSVNRCKREKCSQTDATNLAICDTCSLFTDAMVQILNDISRIPQCSHTRRSRKYTRGDIFNLTRPGCMKILTASLAEDVHVIINRLSEMESHFIQNQMNVERLDEKCKDSEVIIKNLQTQCREYEMCLALEKSNVKNMFDQIDELQKKCNQQESQNKFNESRIDELEELTMNQNETINLVVRERERMQKKLQELNNENELLHSEKGLWKIKFADLQAKYKSKSNDFKGQMQQLNSEMSRLQDNCRCIDARVAFNSQEIDRKSKAYIYMLKRLQDVVTNKIMEGSSQPKTPKHKPQRFPESHSLKAPKRDPLTDMKSQLKINDENIHHLQRESDKLKKTIQHLETYGTKT